LKNQTKRYYNNKEGNRSVKNRLIYLEFRTWYFNRHGVFTFCK